MSDTWPSRITILGIGLLGGSVAKAIRRARPQVKVCGWSRRQSTCNEALRLGVIDEAAMSIEVACVDSEAIVIAAPVDRIASLAITAMEASPVHCLVTDVGSTKLTIVETVARHRLAANKFVAAHPIAGREKAGVEYALESLFDGRCVVLTPDDATHQQTIESAESFWQLTGARTIRLDAAQHDNFLAATSHVPHLVSSAIARLLPEHALPLVGSGWADTTRVAAGDPEMWAAICRENQAAIQVELQRFAGSIQSLIELLGQIDDSQLLQWLREAKAIRDRVS